MLVARLLAFGLALVFAWAAIAKAKSSSSWREALTGYALPPAIRTLALVGVPLVEAGVAAGFLAGLTRAAASLALALTALFTLAVLRARARQGDRIPCGCFGSIAHQDYRLLLARNGVIAAVLCGLLLLGRDVPGYPAAPRAAASLPAALAGAGVVLVLLLWVGVRAGLRRDAA